MFAAFKHASRRAIVGLTVPSLQDDGEPSVTPKNSPRGLSVA